MSDGIYMDIYILISDKHVVLVNFTAPSESKLDREEYIELRIPLK